VAKLENKPEDLSFVMLKRFLQNCLHKPQLCLYGFRNLSSNFIILVGNQDSDNITVFKVDAEGFPVKYKVFDFPSPVCIRFL